MSRRNGPLALVLAGLFVAFFGVGRVTAPDHIVNRTRTVTHTVTVTVPTTTTAPPTAVTTPTGLCPQEDSCAADYHDGQWHIAPAAH